MSHLPKVWLNLEPHPSVRQILEGQAEIVGPLIRPSVGDPLSEIEIANAVLAGTDFPASRDTLRWAGKLKVISRFGIGVDSVDVQAATDYGICVTNTPDTATISVAEYTIGPIVATSRNLLNMDQAVRSREWHSNVVLGAEIFGKTVGLVGLGRVASRVAKILKAFEANVLSYDPYVELEKARELGIRGRALQW